MKREKGFLAILFAASLAIVCVAENAFAARPVIYFSDMTDGPTTGFDGSSIRGAAISIWGDNFGTSRGSSTLTVGGVTLDTDADFAEWGATTNPQTARGLGRITFYLNSSMITAGAAPNTTIMVTVGDVESTTIPFHCRALGSNHIYFYSPSGNDVANGTSISTPRKTGAKIKNTLVAGDIAYLRGGTYTDVDPAYSTSRAAWMSMWAGNSTPANGTAYKSVGVISYPGEVAQIGNGDLYNSGNELPETMIDRFGSTGAIWNYWTFSKLKTVLATCVLSEGAGYPNGDDNLRFVGMDVRTTSTASGTGIPFTKEGGTTGSTNFYLLGNYFHHTGVPLAPAVAPALSAGSGTGLTGRYNAKYTYISWRSAGSLGQESEMSAAGTPVTLSNGALRIAWSQPSTNRQSKASRAFSHVRIYRTKAGGDIYFFDREVPIANGSVDTTTADSALSTRTKIEGGYYVGPMYFGGYGHLDGVYVLYNEMYQCNGTAIQNYGHVSTDYCDNLHFAYNYVHEVGTCAWNNRPAVILGGGDGSTPYVYARKMYVYNNVFRNNYGSSLRLVGGGDFRIFNNTFYADATFGAMQSSGFQMSGSSDTTLQFKNNIVYLPGVNVYNTPYWGSPMNSVTGLSEDHNMFYGLGAGRGLSTPGGDPYPFSGPATGNLYNTIPSFMNPNPVTYSDFALRMSSKARDAGVNTSPTVTSDFSGVIRPQGSLYDIGAFEHSPSYLHP